MAGQSERRLLENVHNFEAEVDFLDGYGQRMRTLVGPPVDGNYTFWISSDDASELFLSTDETPANRVSIAGVSGWTSSREWGKYPEQQSAPRFLEAGRRYYLEAQMVEGGGGDNLAVRWQLPNGNFEEPLTAPLGLPDRDSPGDERIQAYLAQETAAIDARFQDEVFTSVNNFTTLDSYWLADVRAGIEGDYWRLIAYVNNVFDDDTTRTSGSAPDFGAVAVDDGVPTWPQFQTTVTLPNPRVFGIRLSYSF